jgi:hypothetical protein
MASNIFLNERSLAACFGSHFLCFEHRDRRLDSISSRGHLLVVAWHRRAS